MKKLFLLLISLFTVTCFSPTQAANDGVEIILDNSNQAVEQLVFSKNHNNVTVQLKFEDIHVDKQEFSVGSLWGNQDGQKIFDKLFDYYELKTNPSQPVLTVKHFEQKDLEEIKAILDDFLKKDIKQARFSFISKQFKTRKYNNLFNAIGVMQQQLQNVMQKDDKFWQNQLTIKFDTQDDDEQGVLIFYQAVEYVVKLLNELFDVQIVLPQVPQTRSLFTEIVKEGLYLSLPLMGLLIGYGLQKNAWSDLKMQVYYPWHKDIKLRPRVGGSNFFWENVEHLPYSGQYIGNLTRGGSTVLGSVTGAGVGALWQWYKNIGSQQGWRYRLTQMGKGVAVGGGVGMGLGFGSYYVLSDASTALRLSEEKAKLKDMHDGLNPKAVGIDFLHDFVGVSMDEGFVIRDLQEADGNEKLDLFIKNIFDKYQDDTRSVKVLNTLITLANQESSNKLRIQENPGLQKSYDVFIQVLQDRVDREIEKQQTIVDSLSQ